MLRFQVEVTNALSSLDLLFAIAPLVQGNILVEECQRLFILSQLQRYLAQVSQRPILKGNILRFLEALQRLLVAVEGI